MNTIDVAAWLIKTTLLMFIVWAVYFGLRGSNPRWQQGSLRIGSLGIVLLAMLSFVPPVWQWKFIEVTDTPRAVVEASQPGSPNPVRMPHTESGKPATDRRMQAISRSETRSMDSAQLEPLSKSTLVEEPAETVAAKQPRNDWNWKAVIVSVWFTGMLWHLCRWSAGLLGARRLVNRSKVAGASIEERLARIALQMRIATPRVLVSAEIDTPSVVGLIRPTIVLPEVIAEEDLESALAHESCHLVGNDLRWDALLRFLSALLWPHPLMWKVVACHRMACERVCDLVAADFLSDREQYAISLARIASGLSNRPGFGMAMARSPQIVDRLRTLASRITARPLGRLGRFTFWGTAMLVAAVGVTTVVRVQQVNAEEPVEEPRTLKFIVLDASTDQPVSDAEVAFRYYDKQYTRQTIRTDKNGIAEFTYPEPKVSAFLRIMTKRKGFVPYYASFDRQPPRLLPETKTIRMSPGKIVGGIITDKEGAPIEGAKLTIYVPSIDPPKQNNVYDLLDARTGPDGRWQLDAAPSPPDGLRLRVNHDRYQNNYFDVQDSTDATYSLERGWSITGMVKDEGGNPIGGVKITPGNDRFGSSLPKTTTNDAGKFQLFGLKKVETTLTATVNGFAPSMIQVVPDESQTTEAKFVLERGNTIQFRFVDPDGEPIPGAWIAADTWRGLRTVDWRGKSDEQGMVTWNGAPSDMIIYDSGHAGFRSRRNLGRIAQENPHVITLTPEFVVTGNVVDAATGKPIEKFKAQFGWGRSGEIYWTDQDSIRGRDGEFRLTYDEGQDELYVRLSAVGYKPWTSQPFSTDKSPDRLSVPLQPGAGPNGIVLTPDGERAARAVVALGIEGNSFQFQRGYRPYNPAQQTASDSEGRFELAAVDDGVAGILAIVHDRGYAEITLDELAKSPEIRLNSWAKLELEVVEEGQPVAGRRVQFRPRKDRTQVVDIFSYSIEAETDENGRATLERVIPTDGYVSMILIKKHENGEMHYSNASRPIQLQSGQTRSVRFGGSGQTIIGRIRLPDDPPAKHRWKSNEAGELKTSNFNWDHPEHRTYQFLVDDDGRFRIPDVPTGSYELSLELTAQPSADVCGPGSTIGLVDGVECEVTADNSIPLDLGEIEGKWNQWKGVGDSAVNFVAKTQHGKITLDQFGGDVVLLDFWATWCAPCMADLPRLQKLHDKFAGRSDFKLLTVSLDRDFNEALNMADEQAWPWIVADGGRHYRNLIPNAYDVESIPVKFLIGRDGMIVYRGNDWQIIESLIEDELAKPRSSPPSLKLQADLVADDFQPSDRTAAVAIAMSEPHVSDRAGDVEAPEHGLFLFDSAGGLVRKLPNISPNGWLKRPDRIAIDRRRGRVYVLDQDTLYACSTNGKLVYQLKLQSPQAIEVLPDTGELWIAQTDYLNSGSILVLNNQGKEIDRHTVHAFSLRYHSKDKGFWVIDKSARLVSRAGDEVVEHKLPDNAYTFSAIAIDPAGGCWLLEDSHPDVPASREQLWHVTKRGMRKVGEFGAVDHNTYAGLHLRSLALVDDQVWVSVLERLADKSFGPRTSIQRYSKSGDLLGNIPVHAEDLHGTGRGTVWASTSTHQIEFDAKGNEIRRWPRPGKLHEGVFQSTWLLSVD